MHVTGVVIMSLWSWYVTVVMKNVNVVIVCLCGNDHVCVVMACHCGSEHVGVVMCMLLLCGHGISLW